MNCSKMARRRSPSGGQLTLALGLIVLMSCRDAVPQSDDLPSSGVLLGSTLLPGAERARSYEDVRWQPLWRRGGDHEESLLAVVHSLTPTEDGVIAADAGTLEVTRFDGTTGATRWLVGRKGAGPGEFGAISEITVDHDDNTVVLDNRVGRLTTISSMGELLPYRAAGALLSATSICVLPDGSIAAVVQRGDVWVTISRNSTVLRAHRFPAALPRDAPAFAWAGRFAQGASHNDCPIYTVFGYGVGSLNANDEELILRPYIHSVEPPTFNVQQNTDGDRVITTTTLKTGTAAVSRASRWRDTVMLSATDEKYGQVLDLYNSRGEYLKSWKTPKGFELSAYANGVIYAVSGSATTPEITAWRYTSAPDLNATQTEKPY